MENELMTYNINDYNDLNINLKDLQEYWTYSINLMNEDESVMGFPMTPLAIEDDIIFYSEDPVMDVLFTITVCEIVTDTETVELTEVPMISSLFVSGEEVARDLFVYTLGNDIEDFIKFAYETMNKKYNT